MTPSTCAFSMKPNGRKTTPTSVPTRKISWLECGVGRPNATFSSTVAVKLIVLIRMLIKQWETELLIVQVERSARESCSSQVSDNKANLSRSGTLENIIKNQLIEGKLFRDNGFIALIDVYMDPQVSYFNAMEHWLIKGPGHTAPILMDVPDGRKEMQMIASFP